MNAKSKALKVKSSGKSMGFDKSWKIWQRQNEGKPSEKVVHLKGYDKSKRAKSNKSIRAEDLPF